MTTSNTILEKKVIENFISEFNYEPTSIKIEGDYAFAKYDWTNTTYFCRIINGKSIKKRNGITWRLDN